VTLIVSRAGFARRAPARTMWRNPCAYHGPLTSEGQGIQVAADTRISAAIAGGAKEAKQQEMDPYKDKLTPEQVGDLTAYVQSLK